MIESGNLLQQLFEDAGAFVLITDGKFNIRYASAALQSILGLEPMAVVGKNIFDFVPVKKWDGWRACLAQDGNSRGKEIHLESSNGKDLYFDVSVTNRIANHEIQGMVIILQDITDRKQKHFQLEKENEQLDQFIFKTTHDLRSPIHSVIGLINLLEQADEQERQKYLQLVRSNLTKLESLIDEVNKLYRVDKMAIALEKINFNELIEGEITLLKNHPRANAITFEVECKTETELFSDPLRLKTILGNILSNAVKYSDPKKSSSFIRVEANVHSQNLHILVSDNGIGIAQANIGRIFDIFFRATSEASGTGLGLHIVKDTIERLNGTIEVQSQLGLGTQFRVNLPNHAMPNLSLALSVDAKNELP